MELVPGPQEVDVYCCIVFAAICVTQYDGGSCEWNSCGCAREAQSSRDGKSILDPEHLMYSVIIGFRAVFFSGLPEKGDLSKKRSSPAS